MLWEYLILAGFLCLAFGVAIVAIRTKAGNTTIVQGGNVDIQALAEAVAKAVGKEIAEELKEAMKNITVQGGSVSSYSRSPIDFEITMDESVIPVKVETQAVSSNLGTMVKEETSVDKDLQKSKSKLSSLFKNKKK